MQVREAGGLIPVGAPSRAGHGPAHVRVVGRGESAWSPAVRQDLAARSPGGVSVPDLVGAGRSGADRIAMSMPS